MSNTDLKENPLNATLLALNAIDFLDLKKGLNYLSGNQNIYFSELRKFKDSALNDLKALKQYLEQDNYVDAVLIVHTLKGNSAILGISYLEELSDKLEKKLGLRQSDFELELKVFEEILVKFCDDLNQNINKPKMPIKKNILNKTEELNLMILLGEQIESNDFQCRKTYESIVNSVDLKEFQGITELGIHLDDFKFELASAIFKKIYSNVYS